MATKTKKELEAEVRRLRKQVNSKPTGKKPNRSNAPAGPSNNRASGMTVAEVVLLALLVLLIGATFGAFAITKATATAAPAPAPADPRVPVATAAPAGQADPEANTNECRDGEETGNMLNPLERTPVGDLQFATVQEVSVKGGAGFGGYWRWIQVSGPLGTDRQVFDVEITTIHELRYCGGLEAVKSYVSQPEHHIWAMRSTAADPAGNMPAEGEIPVVYVDPVNLTVTFLVPGNAAGAPSLEIIKNHLQLVDLQ